MDRVVTIYGKLLSERNDREAWKPLEPMRWFDPAFQNFVNRELVAGR